AELAEEAELAERDRVRRAVYALLEDGPADLTRLTIAADAPPVPLRDWLASDPYVSTRPDGTYQLRPASPAGGPLPTWAEIRTMLTSDGGRVKQWSCSGCGASVPADLDPAAAL